MKCGRFRVKIKWLKREKTRKLLPLKSPFFSLKSGKKLTVVVTTLTNDSHFADLHNVGKSYAVIIPI
jgi:hypothetical protein